MTQKPSYGPSITAAKLYRKTSAKGATYFTGRMGGVKVTLLKSREVAEDGGEIWELVFAEAAPYQPRQAPSAPDLPAQSKPAQVGDYQRPLGSPQPAASKEAKASKPDFDDSIPF